MISPSVVLEVTATRVPATPVGLDDQAATPGCGRRAARRRSATTLAWPELTTLGSSGPGAPGRAAPRAPTSGRRRRLASSSAMPRSVPAARSGVEATEPAPRASSEPAVVRPSMIAASMTASRRSGPSRPADSQMACSTVTTGKPAKVGRQRAVRLVDRGERTPPRPTPRHRQLGPNRPEAVQSVEMAGGEARHRRSLEAENACHELAVPGRRCGREHPHGAAELVPLPGRSAPGEHPRGRAELRGPVEC